MSTRGPTTPTPEVPMTAPNTMALSKVIDPTMSDDALSDVKRRNVCSSIRRLCKLDGAGLIFEWRGGRLTPSHANKTGRRYLYNVS